MTFKTLSCNFVLLNAYNLTVLGRDSVLGAGATPVCTWWGRGTAVPCAGWARGGSGPWGLPPAVAASGSISPRCSFLPSEDQSACVCLYVYSFISTWWKHNGIDSFYYCALLWAKLNEKQRLAWLHVCVQCCAGSIRWILLIQYLK